MANKLKFTDLNNKELDSNKLIFTGSNETNALSTGSGAPSVDAVVGAIYTDTTNGNQYLKVLSGSGSTKWNQTLNGALTSNVDLQAYKRLSINTIVTSTGSSAPQIGDLVGIWGAGTWATSGNLNNTRYTMVGVGSPNAGLGIAGYDGTNNLSNTELFNGFTWTSASNLGHAKKLLTGFGSQNSSLITGGNDGSNNLSNTELFNGSSWSASSNLSSSKNGLAGGGAQNAGFVTSGYDGTHYLSKSELFNGSSWSASSNLSQSKYAPASIGTQNSSLITGGNDGSNNLSNTELFNGSSWSASSNLSQSKYIILGIGSQNAGLAVGGSTPGDISTTEIFNGSTWMLSGNLSQTKEGLGGAGGQSNAFAAGGAGASGKFKVTELHTQTTYRKMYARYYPSAKGFGILTGPATIETMGNISLTGYYPANKYLVLNRSAICQTSNEFDLTVALALNSIQGAGPTLNFSSTEVTQVMPGMIAIVAGGALNVANVGSFVITRVVPNSSIDINNPSAVDQNPGVGTIQVLSSMLAVDSPSQGDIIIGKTDSSGKLRISRPINPGNITKRLA